MNSYVFVFAALLAVVAAKGPYPKCPWVTAKYPFDEAKFAGDWNVISYVPNASFGEKKCAKMSIAAFQGEAGSTLNYKFNYFADGKAKTGEAISYSKGESKAAMSYTVYKKEEETKFSPVYKKSIIATDYDTYAVSISCRPTFDSETKDFGRDLFAHIYARPGKTLSEDTIKTLKSTLTSYDIEYDSFKTMVHDC